MSISDVTITVNDGALGVLPLGPNTNRVKIGVCTGTTGGATTATPGCVANTIYAINSIDDVKTYLVGGPLAEACALDVQLGGPGLLAVPVTSDIVGGISSITKSNGSSPTITASGTIRESCEVVLVIVGAGSETTATYKYSLDGGITYSATRSVSATTLTGPGYASPGYFGQTGLSVTFVSGSYTAGDTYTFRTFAPHYTNSAITDAGEAIAVLAADSRDWPVIHFVGQNQLDATDADNITDCNTLATAVVSHMSTFATAFRYARAFMDSPDIKAGGAWTSAMDTALLNGITTESARLGMGAGYADVWSPLTGLSRRVCASWPIIARVAQNFGKNLLVDDVAWVGSPFGSMSGVRALWRDERVFQSLSQKFLTLRTHIRRGGFFATSSAMLAPTGSDYTYMPNGFVMDLFASTIRTAALPFLNSTVNVNADGTIDEIDALSIEAKISSMCLSALTGLISPPTSVTPIVQVNRTNDILSTNTLKLKGRITPKGYARLIDIDLGFNVTALVRATTSV